MGEELLVLVSNETWMSSKEWRVVKYDSSESESGRRVCDERSRVYGIQFC